MHTCGLQGCGADGFMSLLQTPGNGMHEVWLGVSGVSVSVCVWVWTACVARVGVVWPEMGGMAFHGKQKKFLLTLQHMTLCSLGYNGNLDEDVQPVFEVGNVPPIN